MWTIVAEGCCELSLVLLGCGSTLEEQGYPEYVRPWAHSMRVSGLYLRSKRRRFLPSGFEISRVSTLEKRNRLEARLCQPTPFPIAAAVPV